MPELNLFVTQAPQSAVQGLASTARAFFAESLAMDFDDCLASDESRLSDWSSCGMPDELGADTTNLWELYRLWDAWMLEHLETRYGLRYSTTAVPLLTVLKDLQRRG